MSEEVSDEQFWKNKMKEYKWIFIVVIIAVAVIIAGVILVLIWYIETSPIGRQGDALIGEWRLDWVVGFMIQIILWELLIVGLPTGLFFGVGGYIVWSRLSDEKKEEFKARDKKKTHRKRDAGSGGGGSLFMFIAYCIYMGLQPSASYGSMYNAPFNSQPYSYWIYAGLYTFMWIVIIIGVPVCIILIIVYFAVWRKKSE
ncbi:MAG: hypothetical protein ACXABG_04960 [Promethearchaeota archaeon]|jgi:hypothetical protein